MFLLFKSSRKVSSAWKKLKIVEIASGLFNFGHLIANEIDNFEYIVIDLPEIINSAIDEIENEYSKTHVKSYEFFKYENLQEYYDSNSNRKVLFLTPGQLNLFKDFNEIDILINHESFSEMNIQTVNSYLDFFNPKIKNQD